MDFQNTNFGGSDYDAERDCSRMSDAMEKVYNFLTFPIHLNEWHTLERIAGSTGVPQSSVGSYLCYLRRDYGFQVPKKYMGNGLFAYQLGRKLAPKPKKMKAIGDKELFGEMMRSIYAYAAQPDLINDAALQTSAIKWAKDMAGRVKTND